MPIGPSWSITWIASCGAEPARAIQQARSKAAMHAAVRLVYLSALLTAPMDARPHFSVASLHPRYWLTWLGMALWRASALLPHTWMLWLGRNLGRGLYRLGGFRRAIAERNLELCFPDLSLTEREALLRRTFENIGISFFEVAMAWWWPWRRIAKRVSLEGFEHIEALRGQGALLMAVHFTTLELGGQVLGHYYSYDAMYRPHDNPVYDYLQRRGRLAGHPGSEVFPRKDVRGVMRALRQGRLIWYAPDQDYGPKQSVFVPFFGVSAASVTATAKFAKAGNARVLPFSHVRLPDGHYRVSIHPPLEQFPSGDEVADAARINRIVEDLVRQQPDQYLWVHRRFKTRPPAEPSLYSVRKRRKRKPRTTSPAVDQG